MEKRNIINGEKKYFIIKLKFYNKIEKNRLKTSFSIL